MKRIKVWLVLMLVLAASVSVYARGQSSAQTGGARQFKVGFSPFALDQAFHKIIWDTVKAGVEAQGGIFVGMDPNNDGARQINQIEDMITQRIDLLIVGPISSDGILPALEACKNAGIPVLNYDSAVTDQDLVKSFITSDNHMAGKLAGEYILNHIAKTGKVIVFDNPDAESVNGRVRGYEEAIRGSGINSVYYHYTGDLQATSEDAITSNPDAIAVFGTVSILSTVAYASLEARNLVGKIQIVSVDGSPEEKPYIKSGGILATAAQSPIGIANKCVEYAFRILRGESVEKMIEIAPFIIDAANLSQYPIDGWQ
jgi:ribose transport system substrate-binding protein